MVTIEFKNAIRHEFILMNHFILAPARNETCRYNRCTCFLKDEVNFTNKSRIRHGSNQLHRLFEAITSAMMNVSIDSGGNKMRKKLITALCITCRAYFKCMFWWWFQSRA